MLLKYLLENHVTDCLLILAEEDDLKYFSIKIDFLKLFESYPDIGDKVLCSPIESLPICDNDIIKAQQIIIDGEEYKNSLLKLNRSSLKKNVHARFYGLPVCPELHRTIFPKNADLGCFLKVSGTVVRVSQSKMLEYQRKYVCVKCKYENLIEAEFENRYVLKAPTKCMNPEKCRSSTFTPVNLVSRLFCKDYQEIKIQEQVNKLSIGTIPGSMWVVLDNDLVDSCKPGDDVHICGTVRRRWRPPVISRKLEVELVLQANYLEVCNSQRSRVIAAAPDVKSCFDEYWAKYEACPLKGRDAILASVCPQVFGLQVVKLALLLTVITGSNHEVDDDKRPAEDENDVTRVRGQCHLLLVGDPGTGKSQLLRAGVDLTPRSVFTSGAGSTKAGLTCSALREDGEWQLEAGALVLSDGGVCCIDEISQLRDHDRSAIHEAMEQQTISIAKAGIVCKLNTRCAVVAACNPKGHYQTDQPLSVNVSLGTPLLSRFDLIFILLDTKNMAWDELVSSYLLFGGIEKQSKQKWSIEKLQMYIGLVGPRRTIMTKSANTILQTYYIMQRKSEYRDPSRTTVRMLDSLIRLSQAHCRLMYRTTILPTDAIVAVSLVDLSMQDCTLTDTVDALHSTFQKHPDFNYLQTAKSLLTKMNLYEIWQEELLYYAKLLQVDHKTLESEIDKGFSKLFSKFDDVKDDNIPLSCSFVTSSYFNNKKNQENNESNIEANVVDKENDNDNNDVSERMAATSKKHATINKEDRNIPNVTKVTDKRKLKEVTADSSVLLKKQKQSIKKKTKNQVEMSESEDEFDQNTVLKNVPSVNDVFSKLGIDFNLNFSLSDDEDADKKCIVNKKSSDTGQNQHKDENLQDKGNKQVNIIKKEKISQEIKQNTSFDSEISSNSTMDKLKQFQFVKNHDLDKILEKDKPCVETIKLEESNKSSSNVSIKKPLLLTSQISMFESSDCELDLDI